MPRFVSSRVRERRFVDRIRPTSIFSMCGRVHMLAILKLSTTIRWACLKLLPMGRMKNSLSCDLEVERKCDSSLPRDRYVDEWVCICPYYSESTSCSCILLYRSISALVCACSFVTGECEVLVSLPECHQRSCQSSRELRESAKLSAR